MKEVNRNKFFNATLGFKTAAAPHDSKETWLISEEYNNELGAFQWQIPLRDAANQAFMQKLAAKEVPVFTRDELDPRGQYSELHIVYTLALLNELSLTYLAQAIIDDDRETVTAMLDKKPKLLLNRNFVVATSEYTGQSFSSDNFLGLACWRKQIEMIKIILPYFKRLQDDDEQSAESDAIKKAGLAQWKDYDMDEDGEIEIPANYQAIIDELIILFKAENIQTRSTQYPMPKRIADVLLSADVETAMTALYNLLLPKERVLTQKNYLEIELLLVAAYDYRIHFRADDRFDAKVGAYCIRVLGILQRFLQPETAKIFCEGLYHVTEKKQPISAQAAALKLKDGTAFYPEVELALRSEVGFECFYDRRDGEVITLWMSDWYGSRGCGPKLENVLKAKSAEFRKVTHPDYQFELDQNQHGRCVIV